MPKRNSTSTNGASSGAVRERATARTTAVASTSITTSPTALVAMLESTSPVRYSEIDSGVAKMLRKLRDQTSSKNAIVTPCITRVKKSHSSTAPSSTGHEVEAGGRRRVLR